MGTLRFFLPNEESTGVAPTNDLESAIVRSISPGPYTAIVREFNNFTGVALVEAYQLP